MSSDEADDRTEAARAAEVLPAEVTRFVGDCIPSVVHLEALLLLRSAGERDLRADEVSKQLYVDTPGVVQALADLVARRLLISAAPNGPFRYAPGSPELRANVELVAEVYRTRLIALSQYIHEHARTRGVHNFAQAFRFRKD